MRGLLKNKKKLMYSLYLDEQPVYAKDSDGNVIYDIIDGEETPRIVEYKNGYSEPIEFFANITFAGGESISEIFGISDEDYDSRIIARVGEFPIKETSLIFQDSEPAYDSNGNLKAESADFRVVKIAPILNEVTYLLKRIVHNG